MAAWKRLVPVMIVLAAGGCVARAPEPGPPPPTAPTAEPPPRPVAVVPPPPEPVLRPGTGSFVNLPQPLAATAPATQPLRAEEGDTVTVSFVDADIRQVAQAVLGDFLGRSYAIDPQVKGTITLHTARPVPNSELPALLDEVLRMNGAALVDGNGLTRVVPLAAAKGKAAPALKRGVDLAGYGMRIVPLRHISASEMAKVLEPMVPADQIVALDDGRNILLLSGSQAELDNLVEVIDIFDVDWLQGMSFGIVPISAVDADTMVGELEAVFGGESGPLRGLVRFVPLQRLNSVMVIASRPERLRQAREWIEQLDRAGESEVQRLSVYRVQHGRAADLARLLGEIFEPERSGDIIGAVAPGAGEVQVLAQKITAAPTATTGEGQAGASSQPAPRSRQGATTVGRTVKLTGGGRIRVVADEKTNSLVVYGTARDYRLVEEALRELDRVPMQVLIEATIAEVTLSDELRYGLQWFFEAGSSEFRLSNALSGLVTPQFPGFAYSASTSGMRVVLDALATITKVNVLSAPKLVVVDNEIARLQVGDQVPVPVQSAVSVVDPQSPIVNTIQFRDTGVILEVVPRISSAGTVTMEIRQEVSDVVDTTTSGIDAPTIQQRSVSSTVAVESGQTVALGGLIRDRTRNGRSGIPLLMDIPLLGYLFSSTRDVVDRTELLVLIAPKVIRSPVEGRAVTDELRRRMKALERTTF